MTRKVFLWDIDGTLLLTGGSGKTAFNKVFRDLYGIAEIWQGFDPSGRTDYSIIDELFEKAFGAAPSETERERIATYYKKCLIDDDLEWSGMRLMPHAKETLLALAARDDVSLGLATGNFKETAYYKLKKAGLDQFFSYGGFGCDAFVREDLTRRALERAIQAIGGAPVELYLIGDTVHDIRCGLAIGAKTVGVLTGYATRESLLAAGATWVMTDLTGFFEAVRV